jgi:hypothetical protein
MRDEQPGAPPFFGVELPVDILLKQLVACNSGHFLLACHVHCHLHPNGRQSDHLLHTDLSPMSTENEKEPVMSINELTVEGNDISPIAACDLRALNKLLRGELSAIDSYKRGIPRFEDLVIAEELNRISADHLKASTAIKSLIEAYGGEAAENSGAWGTIATTLTDAAKLLGPETVLQTLRRGELIGISEYESALENEGIAPECKQEIRNHLLPKCYQHVDRLEELVEIGPL